MGEWEGEGEGRGGRRQGEGEGRGWEGWGRRQGEGGRKHEVCIYLSHISQLSNSSVISATGSLVFMHWQQNSNSTATHTCPHGLLMGGWEEEEEEVDVMLMEVLTVVV